MKKNVMAIMRYRTPEGRFCGFLKPYAIISFVNLVDFPPVLVLYPVTHSRPSDAIRHLQKKETTRDVSSSVFSRARGFLSPDLLDREEETDQRRRGFRKRRQGKRTNE